MEEDASQTPLTTTTTTPTAKRIRNDISSVGNHRFSCGENNNHNNKSNTSDGCGADEDDDEGEEEECDAEAWETLSKSFRRVQTVLDQNRALIQQVNDNHQSKLHDNLVKNVSLIREINAASAYLGAGGGNHHL